MTTQRNRLAEMLFNISWGDDDNEVLTELRNDPDRTEGDPLTHSEEWFMSPLEFADALLARGVRVVDEAALIEAIRVNLRAVRLDGMLIEEPVTIEGVEYWRKWPIAERLARAVLSTLDGSER